MFQKEFGEGLGVFDWVLVDAGDDISDSHARFLGGRSFSDADDIDAVLEVVWEACDAQLYDQLGGKVDGSYADGAAPHFSEFDELLGDDLCGVHVDCEADAACLFEDGGVDSDDLRGCIDEGPAAVAFVDGGSMEDEVDEG